MKFSKFVRENSRTLIMVVMALLLVAFLIPDTIQALGNRDRTQVREVGRAGGRKVTTRDLEQVQGDLQLLSRAALRQYSDQQLLDMYLLMSEAEQAGIRIGDAEVDTFLQQAGFTADAMIELQRTTRRSPAQIRAALARWLAADRLRELQAVAVVDSLPRQEGTFRDTRENAVAQLSILDVKAFIPQVPEPSEEELQSFFEQGRERVTTHTEDELVFGWRLPDRVQIEYLTVDPEKVKDSITLQMSQVKRHYEENQAAYTKPDTSTQPAPGQPPARIQRTFEEARDDVRRDARLARAAEVSQSLVSDILSEAQRPWTGSTRDENGFLTPPPGDPISFVELKDRFAGKGPVEHGLTELVSPEQLAATPGIGTAGINTGRGAVRMPQLATRVQGILEKPAPGDNLPVYSLFEPSSASIMRTNPATRVSAAHQGFVFRFVQVAPDAPPATLDEVRAQVVADWKLARAFELARAEAEKLAARAREVGLAAAVEEATELKNALLAADPPPVPEFEGPQLPPTNTYLDLLKPASPPTLVRTSKNVIRVGAVQEFPRRVFALADEPLAAGGHRAGAVPVATNQKWVVAELTEVKPLYAGQFETHIAQSPGNREELSLFNADWVASERVKQRTGFIQAAQP